MGEVREDSGSPYIGTEDGSRASRVSSCQALMEDKGWAWHGHGICDAFMANQEGPPAGGDEVDHGEAPGHGLMLRRGGRQREQGQE